MLGQVGLCTDVGKTVRKIYQPCCDVRKHLKANNAKWMMGEGMTYQGNHKQRAQCPECVADLVTGSLAAHLQAHHRIILGAQWDNPPPTPSGVTQNVLRIINADGGYSGVPVGGVSGIGSETNRAEGALCAPPHAGHHGQRG